MLSFLAWAVVALQAFTRVLAQPEFFRWSRDTFPHDLQRRQPAYHPEAGSCGDGTTCPEACGDGYETCAANTELMLFCFNPAAGQKCCQNGDGRACDPGYYCTHDSSGKTWCCENNADLAECASAYGVTSVFTTMPTTTSSPMPISSTPTSTSSSSIIQSPLDSIVTPTPTPNGNGTGPYKTPPVTAGAYGGRTSLNSVMFLVGPAVTGWALLAML